MKTLVVYDSQYGNTEKVGMAIGDAIPEAKGRHPRGEGVPRQQGARARVKRPHFPYRHMVSAKASSMLMGFGSVLPSRARSVIPLLCQKLITPNP
jgi:hypothetical protein